MTIAAPRPLLRTGAGAAVAIVAAGALIRLWRIGHQSFWLDESYTASIMRMDFGGMLQAIPRTETSPPLYYLIAWPWAKLFGTGEAALRALSALFGTATVAVAWRLGRELFSARAGLLAAALVAVNPFFVWYSQEARSYALLVLLAMLSLLALARRAYGAWALVAALAILTHYFAAFLVVPEAFAVVCRGGRRAALALLAPLAAGAAVLPLALHQRSSGHVSYIAGERFATRVAQIPKAFVTGELGLPLPILGALAGLAVAAGVAWALIPRRDGAAPLLAGLAAASFAIPLAMAAAGLDYLTARNAIVGYAPLAVLAAAGFARRPRAGVAVAAVVVAVALVTNAFVAYDPSVQRDDWRGAARALGAASAIVLTPDVAWMPLSHYAGPLAPLAPAGARVSEVDLVGNARPARFQTPPAPPGFALAGSASAASYEVIRYRAPAPVAVTPAILAASRLGSAHPAFFIRR